MKRSIKLQAMAFICAFIFFSCKTDEPGGSTSQNILPKKVVSTYSNYPTSKEVAFTYNGNKLSEINMIPQEDVSKVKFTYTGDNITKIETYTGKDFSTYATSVFEYNNDKVSKKTTTYPSGTNTNVTTYAYNTTDSTVTATTQYISSTINTIYYTKNKNLSKKEILDATGAVTSTTTYDFDTKNNYLKNITGIFKIPELENIVWDLANVNNNNVTKITMPLSSKSFTYEYNSNNYPTKKVETQNTYITTSVITYQ